MTNEPESVDDFLVLQRDDSEPLLPELEDCVGKDGWVRTPFHIHHLGYGTKNINDAHRDAERDIEQALDEGDWSLYLELHRRPYRLQVFYSVVCRNLTDSEYWQFLSDIYVDSENLWQEKTVLRTLLSSKRRQRHLFMDADERTVLGKLPSRITVHRGHMSHNRRGWSWTTDADKARWFATRFLKATGVRNMVPMLSTGLVSKRDVIAYLGGRNEREIVVDPRLVEEISTVKL